MGISLKTKMSMLITWVLLLAFPSLNAAGKMSVLKADSQPPKCVVTINGTSSFKDVGEEWTVGNSSCIRHLCELDYSGNPHETIADLECPTECEEVDFELVEQNDECCPRCVKTKCKYKNNLYEIGESWNDHNGCTLFQCAKVEDTATMSVYTKSCPELPDCAEEDIFIEDCCKYCRKKHLTGSGSSSVNTKLGSTTNEEQYPLLNYYSHPCKRECTPNSAPMICEYQFYVEWYETLSKACYDCPYNLTDCNRPHCIATDGAPRSVVVINRMMPGPTIDVCLNDLLVVDVKNLLLGESTTIHWHGIHQRENPYMDGVPHISQCPIQPHTTFRYTFRAENPGTQFWHSHTGMQRGDGSFGALIIRQPKSEEVHSKLYDYDLPEHVMMVQDWAHVTGVAMFSSHHHSFGSNKPVNILINGKGRYYAGIKSTSVEALQYEITTEKEEYVNFTTLEPLENDSNTESFNETVYLTDPNEDILLLDSATLDQNHSIDKRDIPEAPELLPLAVFRVKKGFNYRFRVINAEFLNCPIAISIDNHSLLVINSDGYDFEPVEVDTLVIYAGERFDFILNANKSIRNYWIRYKGLMDCDQRFTSAHQAAILRYEGAPEDEDPPGIPSYDFQQEGIELNSLNERSGAKNKLMVTDLNAIAKDDDWLQPDKEPDYKFYIYYDFYPKNNPHFYLSPWYGFEQVNKTDGSKLFTPQLNHISLKYPSSPLLPARDMIDESKFCNETSLAEKGINCREEFCECSHVLQVRLGSVVELIIVDEGVTYDANHPFHLHGNAFRVIGMDRLKQSISIEEVKGLDSVGLLQRKFSRAPIKDTVTIPDGGYTIIRYKADNPGFWLLHCHIEFHAETGMAVVMKVGQNDEMAPVPRNFPTCSDYKPPIHMNDGSGAAVRISESSGVVRYLISILCVVLLLLW